MCSRFKKLHISCNKTLIKYFTGETKFLKSLCASVLIRNNTLAYTVIGLHSWRRKPTSLSNQTLFFRVYISISSLETPIHYYIGGKIQSRKLQILPLALVCARSDAHAYMYMYLFVCFCCF